MKKTWKGNFFCDKLLLDSKKIIKLGYLPKEKDSPFCKTSVTTEGLLCSSFRMGISWLNADEADCDDDYG
jgi:hypothetical protein